MCVKRAVMRAMTEGCEGAGIGGWRLLFGGVGVGAENVRSFSDTSLIACCLFGCGVVSPPRGRYWMCCGGPLPLTL